MSDSSPPRGSTAAALGVSTRAFDLLRDLIARELGLDYEGTRASLLEDKLNELVTRHAAGSHLDLYYMLRYDDARDALWAEMADHLSVPETFFWRQPEQILAVAEVIAPELLADPGRDRVRIWSAACCSGEEPLSVALALDAAGIPLERVEIDASDASPRMIERARRGVYTERSLRRLPDAHRARYFAPAEGGWRIDPRLQAAVRYQRANLVDRAAVASLGRADVVLCRNVFIYFSDAAMRGVVGFLEESMPDDGVLFLGAAESLARVPTRFQLHEVGGAFAYRKAVPGELSAGAAARSLDRARPVVSER